ncbi:MAG: class I SAM-dependent methyltransferase [Nitrospirota bacterium]|nr:MAG: class I SAM-dependent methyltransferase [Nitrospirota bacterium]
METPSQPSGPSPALFFQTVNAHQRTEVLRTAIELELFTAIAEGLQTSGALAKRCGASERGVRMLADSLTVAGFLNKENSEYTLTPDSKLFLDKRSPAYLGATMDFMLSQPLVEGFKKLTGAVQKGGTVVSDEGTTEAEHPEWVTFAHSMVPMMKGPAGWIANWVSQNAPQTRKVLDVAASHGIFGVEIAKKVPETEITALDWANVLTVAQENAEAAGIKDRFHTLPGSAFQVDLGHGYDLVLLTNFLHHFDVPTCEAFLKKVHASLNKGGQVITLEFVPNEDRISPPAMADFGLIMLATTPSGDAYTFTEYDRMFRNAGFNNSEMHDVPASNQRAIITQK